MWIRYYISILQFFYFEYFTETCLSIFPQIHSFKSPMVLKNGPTDQQKTRTNQKHCFTEINL